MKSKHKVFIATGVCVCFLLSIVAIVFIIKYDFGQVFNQIFEPNPIEVINLTEAQKLEDFESMFQIVTRGIPMIDEYESVYGFNFKDRKDQYIQLIKSTQTDFEFYCVMYAIMQDIPSFHTGLTYPRDLGQLNCYNSDHLAADRDIYAHTRYWADVVDRGNEAYTSDFYVFKYVDGQYLHHPLRSDLSDISQGILTEVNGVGADEYAQSVISFYGLNYDGGHDKAYRTGLIFNSTHGTPVRLTIQLPDGTSSLVDAFSDVVLEGVYATRHVASYPTEDYFIYEDDSVSYIKIDNMNIADTRGLTSALKQIKNENVILDLRDNYGGDPNFAARYIYPYLFSADFEVETVWYMPDSEENQTIFRDIFHRILLKPKKCTDSPYATDEDMWYCPLKSKYRGQSDMKRNVIILTSQDTGSAADQFVSNVKEQGLATVIGQNTGGEGLMGSYNACAMPNSRLVYVYMPGGAQNPDGSDNSVVGTAPDIYVSQSYEDFYAELEAYTGNDLKDQLRYDTMLRYSFNFLGANSNE